MRSNMREQGCWRSMDCLVACVQNGSNLVSYCTFSSFSSLFLSHSSSLLLRESSQKLQFLRKYSSQKVNESEKHFENQRKVQLTLCILQCSMYLYVPIRFVRYRDKHEYVFVTTTDGGGLVKVHAFTSHVFYPKS